jgi:hypothetical protein
MKHDVRVLEQSWHRNGIGGAGFVVSLVEWIGTEAPSPHFVAISFPSDDKENRRAMFIEQTAVLSVDLTFAGNIGMGGGNSWRGSDNLGNAIADAWQAKCLADKLPYDPFGEDA